MRHMYAAGSGLHHRAASWQPPRGRNCWQVVLLCTVHGCHLCRFFFLLRPFFGLNVSVVLSCTVFPWQELTLCCRGEERPDSMENVLPGVRIMELSPPVRAPQALPAQQAPQRQAAPGTMQPARVVQGFAPAVGSQGILKRAQASPHFRQHHLSCLHCSRNTRVIVRSAVYLKAKGLFEQHATTLSQ